MNSTHTIGDCYRPRRAGRLVERFFSSPPVLVRRFSLLPSPLACAINPSASYEETYRKRTCPGPNAPPVIFPRLQDSMSSCPSFQSQICRSWNVSLLSPSSTAGLILIAPAPWLPNITPLCGEEGKTAPNFKHGTGVRIRKHGIQANLPTFTARLVQATLPTCTRVAEHMHD